MGYLFLTFSLLASTTKGYCGKMVSGHLSATKDSLMANIIRMPFCMIIGFVIVLFSGDLKQLVPSAKLLMVAALSGISTAIAVVTWLIAVKKSAYMMLDIALMLGVLIPTIAGSIFFGESIKMTQWLGIAVLFIAVMIMGSYNNSVKSKLTLPTFLILLTSGIANGITDFSQKLFVKSLPDISVSVFNFYTYAFAAVTLIITYLLIKPQETNAGKDVFRKVFGYVVIMAACLFINSYFKTLAANYLDAVLLYPLSQGAALILSTIMSAVFFKEKITPKCIIGLLTAFCGLLIINML